MRPAIPPQGSVRSKFVAALALAAGALALGACGSSDPARTGAISHLHYITIGQGVSGLVAKAKNGTISACLSGTSDTAGWTQKIQSTVQKWLRPMAAWTSAPIAAQVEVRPDGTGCDFDVRVAPGTWANTSVGSRPTVRMADTGYFASYNVLLHELGHAFALGDTYQGASGDCKPGQPQAVMCNTSFDDLQSDDIAGLKDVFQRTFPGEQPPAGGGTVPQPTQGRIAVAVADGATGGVRLFAGVSGLAAGQDTGAMAICDGDRAACGAATATWAPLGRATTSRPGVAVFTLAQEIAPVDGKVVTFRYQGSGAAGGAILQAVSFRRR